MNNYPIKKFKINDDYILIYLDDINIMVDLDTYNEYNLYNKRNIDQDLYDILISKEKIFKAYRSCIRKLSIKDYSVKQIKDRKIKKELEDKDIEDIIDKLIKYNLLNDEQYCINRINSLNNSNHSYDDIKYKLFKDGISKSIIDSNLICDDDKEYDKALTLFNKFNKTINNKSLKAKKQTILMKLTNSGYKYDVARNILDNNDIDVENELELLSKLYSSLYNRYSKKYEGYELKNRIYNNLLSKGYKIDDIKTVMEDYHE